jgi:hypothetical protein
MFPTSIFISEKNQLVQAIIFLPDVGVQKWIKIIPMPAWTPHPPSAIASTKRNWSNFFPIFFLECITNLNTYP